MKKDILKRIYFIPQKFRELEKEYGTRPKFIILDSIKRTSLSDIKLIDSDEIKKIQLNIIEDEESSKSQKSIVDLKEYKLAYDSKGNSAEEFQEKEHVRLVEINGGEDVKFEFDGIFNDDESTIFGGDATLNFSLDDILDGEDNSQFDFGELNRTKILI
jgi:hypothetical protein